MHHQAIQLTRKANGEVEDVDHLLYLTMALGFDLAHLQRHQIAQGFLDLAQGVAEVADHLAALGGGNLAPAFESRLGILHDLGIGGAGRLPDFRNRFSGCGVVGDELLALSILEPGLRAAAGARVDILYVELLKQCLHVRLLQEGWMARFDGP